MKVHSIPNRLSTKPSMPRESADISRPRTIWMEPGDANIHQRSPRLKCLLDSEESASPTFNRPEHGVVVTVADSGWVCETGSPQAGPVPGHLDDGRAPHAPDWGDLPALHGHGAGHEDPSQNAHQETPDLDHTDLHLGGVSWSPVDRIFSILNVNPQCRCWCLPVLCPLLMQRTWTSWAELKWRPTPLLSSEKRRGRVHRRFKSGDVLLFSICGCGWEAKVAQVPTGLILNLDRECSPKHLSRITLHATIVSITSCAGARWTKHFTSCW